MPVTNLTIAYHQQDTDYYCGAACAQMVLDSIGATLLDQDPLYGDNHSHSTLETGWYTGPDGLEVTMNARRPPGFGKRFAAVALDQEDAISRKIVWSIHHHRVAAIALVEGSDHWVVVRGVETSGDPADPDDTSYDITGFYLNNPWPPTPDSGPPPPHANSTDGCGIGEERGVPNEHVARATWQDTYMTGVTTGHWSGKYLAVCAGEPPALTSGHVPRPDPPDRRGYPILPPSVVPKLALKGMREHHLDEQSGWSLAFTDAEPGDPLLVQRIDRADSFYYMLPMRSASERTIVVAVDARFGNYRQSVVAPRGTALEFQASAGNQQLLERLEPYRHMLGGLRGGGIVLRPESLSVSPTLVWKPCRESLSPFYPFHVITIGARRLYFRVDGRLFTRLTPAGRGL